MKINKLKPEIIFDYYANEVRPLAEHSVAIWNSGLTKGQLEDLETNRKGCL